MSDYFNPQRKIQKHGNQLPHWQQGEVMQFITFRLGDAMPASKLRNWREQRDFWLNHHPKPWTPQQEREYHLRFTTKIEQWLDQGAGSCLLANPEHRKHVEQTLMRFHKTKVEHHAWVIMPNHLHLIFKPLTTLSSLIKAWKGSSSRAIGMGSIWQKNYRDTLIRDSQHFANAVRYIRRNPAHLAPDAYTLWQSSRALSIR